MSLRESCWQCDLDIPHVCYHGFPDARWGLHDGAIEALGAMHRYMSNGGLPRPPTEAAAKKKRRKR